MTALFGTGRVAYPGLRAFGREEFDLFFGRESCVDEMVDTLGRTCFLAVLGTSGSGKSSLVRTGLLNALELGFLASAGSTWRIAEFRPRGQPIRSLAIALLEVQGNASPEEAEIEILSAFLRRGPRSLIEWASAGHLPPRANLMVLVDQFEELFRYEDYSGREEAEAFVGLLLAAAHENAPLFIAITMRSEYLGACTLIDGLPEVINRSLYLTPRMSREECRQAIVGPAQVCGFRIEDGLVNKLLNDLTDFAPWEFGGGHDQQRRLGRRADQLPLMQHVLNLLWQKARARNETDIVLTLDDYQAAGGLGGALDRHADEIAATVPPEHADVIDTVFRALVTGKTVSDAVRRPTRFGELVVLADGRRDSVAAVVDTFRAPGVNFLTPGESDALHDDTIVDISHESLIRQWRRLSRCLEDEAHSADAWHQLLSRSERYRTGAGGLLTGLDLDNLVDWWEREKPTAAWANRYGDHFDEAQKYLRDSQFAEADLKRREEEEARKLLAAEEAASSGRRFKRLAAALAAALLIAFGATGAAIYLWRESNAEALAALEAQQEAEAARQEADAQRALAESARAEAEEQRVIAEAEAAAAEAARQEADAQRAIAEVERLEAERARAAAEAAEQEAILARRQADQIIDTSIAYFAKSLGERVASIHGDPSLLADLGYAGGLLARLAQDTRADADASTGVDTSFIDALRPAFVVQGALSAGQVPSVEPTATGEVTRWLDPPGGPGLTATIDWTGRSVRLADRTGRVVARYEMPAGFWGAGAATPFAATDGDGMTVAVLADKAARLWVGDGSNGAIVPAADGDLRVGRIDDVMADPATGRIFVAYGLGDTGQPGQSLFGSGLRISALERDGDGWRVAGVFRMPRGPLSGESVPLRLVAATDNAVYTVADGAMMRTDMVADRTTAMDIPGIVVDAGMTGDGKYLLAGGLRDEAGTCFEPGRRDGFLDPWLRRGPDAPQPAAINVEAVEPGSAGQPPITIRPGTPAECLLLLDLESRLPLWRGEASGTKFGTVRASEDGAIEVIEGKTPGLNTLRIAPGGDTWAAEARPFEPADWGLAGFGEAYAAKVATGSAFPSTLTAESAGRLIGEGVLRTVAATEPGGRIIAWRIGKDEVQIVRPTAVDGGESEIEVLVYRPGQDGFVRDGRIDARRAGCLPQENEGVCRFDSAALSPDGNWLLVTSNGRHAFVGQNGILAEWQPNVDSQAGDAMAGVLTFTALVPLDREGRSFIASAEGGAGLRRITRLAGASQPQWIAQDRPDRQSPRGLEAKSGDGGSLLGGAGGTGGTGGSAGGAATVVTEVRLPGHVASDLTGFATAPDSAMLYVWGPRIGIRAVPQAEGDILTADVEFPAPVADAAALGNGDVVAVMTDGQIVVVPADRFRQNTEGASLGGPLPVRPTGLGSFGSIDLWADAGRIIVNAGESGGGFGLPPPMPWPDSGATKVRALGYRLGGNGELTPAFVVPWDRFIGQLGNGEVVSVENGPEVFAEPRPLPADSNLLALAIMREEQISEETPEFEIGFEMLHMRFAGNDGAATSRESCGWVLGVAVRMAGELQENIGEDVKRICGEPAITAPVINAIFDDRFDEQIGALIRLAPASPLARAVLISTLGPVAPKAAEALAGFDSGTAQDRWETTLANIAESGALPVRADDPDDAGFDPFAHWMLAMETERDRRDATGLADALFHYAHAERLFEAAGVRTPVQVVKRRLALARILADDVVLDVFARLEQAPIDPAAAGISEPVLREVPLDAVADWLAGIGGEAEAERLDVLTALVEELRGDEIASTDPQAAGAHYRTALSLVLRSEEALSEHVGILGKIEEAEEIGVKLAALGDVAAGAETAAAVLGIIDAVLTQPVRRDIDPPELRTAISSAFTDLAAAGEAGYDLAAFRNLGLKFLDYDWESRYQSINQVGAERFYRELTAAEAFLTAALDQASDEDRPYWLALRGRMRFWLSTLENEGLPYDGATFRDWIEGALADYAAAGGAEKVGLWDATIIGGANSRMIELAASNADAAAYLDSASAAFLNAMLRDEFIDLSTYRQRLAYDGLILALERGMIRIRNDAFLSGVGPQPGDPDYDRQLLADLGYTTLALARARQDLRAQAEVNGLLERNSIWSLDTVGDFYWGVTAAQLGALLRGEQGLNGTPDLCERLAAHPYDVTRSTAAVDYGALDVDAVLNACDDGTARHLYHQARALSKAGNVPPSEILRLLLPAAREGLPIAYNNISILMSDAGGATDDVQALVTTFSQLSLIEAYPQIAALLRAEKKSAERAETFEWLAYKAAALGVPEAYIDIADLTPDVLTRALNYLIARDLFAEAGRTAEAAEMQAKLDAFNLSSTNVQSLMARAAGRARVVPQLIDDALVTRIEDLLWDARSQASLR